MTPLNYDEAVERFVINWWQDYVAGFSFPADLTRHPRLAALSSAGVVYDPVSQYWPPKADGFRFTLRRQLGDIQGHASWAAGRIVWYLTESPRGVNFSDDDLERFRLSVADVTMGGHGFDDFHRLGLPQLTELARPVEREYDEWRGSAGYLPPPFRITPARTAYVNRRGEGQFVLFGNRGVSGVARVVGVKVPKSLDAYRRLPVAEWKALAARFYKEGTRT